MRITTMFCVVVLMTVGRVWGQTGVRTIPKIVEKDGRHALLVDGQPFLMLGGQVHNSSGWPGMLPQVWLAVKTMHANTLEVPIYWEQIEPQPGKFDFSLIDTLLKQGREHKVHLVLLWFATWKNGSNHYMPEWMKRDAVKYPNITGHTGLPVSANVGKAWQYLKVEEGKYENGTFKTLRIRNGDETDWGGPRCGAAPVVLHTTLITR